MTAGYEIQVVYPYVTSTELHERVSRRNSKIGRAIPYEMVRDMEDGTPANAVGSGGPATTLF